MADIIVLILLLATGYFFGRMAEKRHYKSILQREKKYQKLTVVASKFPPAFKNTHDTELVMGSVVVSVDYFKRFVASLRNLIGGRVRTYETLVDRARREAILRMKEEAARLGARMIFNIKLETASISKNQRNNNVGSVEVLAYGTAIIPPRAD
ncbi:MAG: heavy metal-binding domain-containing protein [Gammaproteobacteria bacterium]